MSYLPVGFDDGTDPNAAWQARLAATARALPYPATPRLDAAALARLAQRAAPTRAALAPGLPARPTLRRGWAVAAVLVALALASLAIPAVRAGLVEFLQIGAVRLQFTPPASATPTASATAQPAAGAGVATARPSPTPRPTPTPLRSVLDLAGETTLDEARASFGAPIRLPAYPPDLGEPDHVFLQNLDGAAVVLVWTAPAAPDQVRLTLHVLTSEAMARKMLFAGTADVDAGEVNGQPAVWVDGRYMLETQGHDWREMRLVDGHVLLWTEGELTYRLETDLPLDEAIQIAESLE